MNYLISHSVILRSAQFASKRFLLEGFDVLHETLARQLLSAGEQVLLRQNICGLMTKADPIVSVGPGTHLSPPPPLLGM